MLAGARRAGRGGPARQRTKGPGAAVFTTFMLQLYTKRSAAAKAASGGGGPGRAERGDEQEPEDGEPHDEVEGGRVAAGGVIDGAGDEGGHRYRDDLEGEDDADGTGVPIAVVVLADEGRHGGGEGAAGESEHYRIDVDERDGVAEEEHDDGEELQDRKR